MMKRNRGVFIPPISGSYLQIAWCGMDGTDFYIKARSPSHARVLFDALIQSEDVVGISLYIDGKFQGGRDGGGS